jgi:hypothetical protein
MIEAHVAELVVKVRKQAEIAVLGDPPGHVAQFLAHAAGVHVEDDCGPRPFAVRTRGEGRHAAW